MGAGLGVEEEGGEEEEVGVVIMVDSEAAEEIRGRMKRLKTAKRRRQMQ